MSDQGTLAVTFVCSKCQQQRGRGGRIDSAEVRILADGTAWFTSSVLTFHRKSKYALGGANEPYESTSEPGRTTFRIPIRMRGRTRGTTTISTSVEQPDRDLAVQCERHAAVVVPVEKLQSEVRAFRASQGRPVRVVIV